MLTDHEQRLKALHEQFVADDKCVLVAINPNLDGIRDSADTLREVIIQKRKNML